MAYLTYQELPSQLSKNPCKDFDTLMAVLDSSVSVFEEVELEIFKMMLNEPTKQAARRRIQRFAKSWGRKIITDDDDEEEEDEEEEQQEEDDKEEDDEEEDDADGHLRHLFRCLPSLRRALLEFILFLIIIVLVIIIILLLRELEE